MAVYTTLLQSLSTSDVLKLGALGLLLYIFAIAIYRLYFHPLAKYPGPFWARLTTIPASWHTYKKERHLWLKQLHDEYGTKVRYDPNWVAVNTSTAFRTVTGPKGNNKKAAFYTIFPKDYNNPSTLQVLENNVHGRKRRMLSNAFSDKAVRQFEPFVVAELDRWCELLGDEIPEGGWSESLNMADWLNWFVFDVMGDLCLGRSFGMKEKNSDMRYIIHLMAFALEFIYPLSRSPFAPLWAWLKPRGLDRLMEVAAPKDLRQWWAWLEEVLVERTKAEEEAGLDETKVRKDFFHYLFKAGDPETGEKGLSPAELWEELQLLVMAGADTTAVVLAGMIFYMTRNADVTAKLSEEILSTFGSSSEIVAGPKLNSCRYLRAVIQEGLRMAPPVTGELGRQVQAGGVVVDGDYFPEGTHVTTCLWALSYNEDIFPEPTKFHPERWIVGAKGVDGTVVTAESVELADKALCAFSAGARGCIGKALAWLEMSLVLAKIMHLFELRRDPHNNLGGGDPNGPPGRTNVDQYQLYDTFVAARDGPLVQLKKRAKE